MILSKLTIAKKGDYWHVVDEEGSTIGRMHDFYYEQKKPSISLARSPFPFTTQENKFDFKRDAERALQQMKAHVQAVLEMEPKKRNGSSQHWKE